MKRRVMVDDEEQVILSKFREIRKHGYGRLDVVVAGAKVEIIHQTRSSKLGVAGRHRKEVDPS